MQLVVGIRTSARAAQHTVPIRRALGAPASGVATWLAVVGSFHVSIQDSEIESFFFSLSFISSPYMGFTSICARIRPADVLSAPLVSVL